MAGEVSIEHARFEQGGQEWQVSVTLSHADSGWDHYADGWRVVDGDGQELGHRTLYHPHVDEQPFTRSQRMTIPAGVRQVFVEAHDTVHGWSGQRLAVDLQAAAGPGFEVRR
jgi:hypothetical protein